MSNMYYYNVFGSIAEGDKSWDNIKKSVTPYEIFVKNAINALKHKQNIKAKWKKIGGEVIQLEPINQESFYKLSMIYEIKIISTSFEEGEFEIPEEEDESFLTEEGDIVFISKTDRKKFNVFPKLRVEKNKKIVKFNLEDYSYFNNSNNYILKKGDFDEVNIKPLWLDEKEISIRTIVQNDKFLEFKLLNNGNLKVYGLNKDIPIYVNDEKTKFQVLNSFDESVLNQYKVLRENGDIYILSSKKPIIEGVELSEETPKFPFEEFKYKNSKWKGENFKFNSIESSEKMKLIIDPLNSLEDIVVFYKEFDFRIKKIEKSDQKEIFRIQLEEIDDINDDVITSSPLEHFFEDDVEIYERTPYGKRKFEIFPNSANNSDFSFILKEKTKTYSSNSKPVFPEGDTLELSLNTYQLEKQLEALNVFINRPLEEQKPLLDLFKPISDVQWPNFPIKKIEEDEWFVLKDPSRKGTENQRLFVERAISTTDFMLLEGPPGSGKTTAILELICQLIKEKKRILLCGSTHVAIDNVLERLKHMEFFENILPVRIGDEHRMSEDVQEFQIDNIELCSGLDKQLILDSANLVCGTTLGILQHPNFKVKNEDKVNKNKISVRDKSIYPEFDYLIIDESSKTTFNEFLIPALFAKKWILVGDVKQLSPFTDRGIIESNVKNLVKDNKNLIPNELQNICFLLKQLCMDSNKNIMKFIVPLSSREIPYLIEEVNNRFFNGKKYLIITNNINQRKNLKGEDFEINTVEEVKNTALYLNYKYKGIFIESNLLKELENYIPVDFLLIRSSIKNSKKEPLSLELRQNLEKDFLEQYFYKDRKIVKGMDIPLELNTTFKEKTWASEISWMLIRNFELKNLRGKKAEQAKNLEKTIDDLLPMSKSRSDIDSSLFILKQVALPSILESLQRGIDKKERYHATTTLTEGFTKIRKKDYVNNRFITLNYQYRMHPDISKLPRELFYNKEALNDAEMIDRDWDYKRYLYRNIWIDHNYNTTRTSNKEEVNIIKRELEALRRWKLTDKKMNTITVGIITFYKRQERELRTMLREYCSNFSQKSQNKKMSQFVIENNEGNKIIDIKLYTVDKFQGQEADVIFLSMVRTNKDGFMDNPNRLNVAITRAKYQMVYVGMHKYYSERSSSNELKEIALNTQKFVKGDIYENKM
ncbi:AAA domain-containing protein [Cetobacterium sp. SF1]|uniref:AAA domain-containing protein n=1 Tax=Cetobacterium sp. SF1 TaxID=3417654 RepID=UPI003CFB9030